jgi:hypothetical protein
MPNKLFAQMVLPVRPLERVDGAGITLVEAVEDEVAVEAFFGGYADDFLADLGFDMMETAPEATPTKAKRTQG